MRSKYDARKQPRKQRPKAQAIAVPGRKRKANKVAQIHQNIYAGDLSCSNDLGDSPQTVRH